MKSKKQVLNRFEQRRQALLKQLSQLGPFVEGSLIGVKHPTCKHVAWRLTFKVKAKTRTVYVPVEMTKEVRQWVENYRALKRLAAEISNAQLARVRLYVGEKRRRSRSA